MQALLRGQGVRHPYVKLKLWCEQYHCLPAAGGYLDQDWYTMRVFQLIDELLAQERSFDEGAEEARKLLMQHGANVGRP